MFSRVLVEPATAPYDSVRVHAVHLSLRYPSPVYRKPQQWLQFIAMLPSYLCVNISGWRRKRVLFH